MGGVVSAADNNDDLVDNLCQADYIRRPEVETVFRKIDRGFYIVSSDEKEKLDAYTDSAWRKGNLHLSAPCIYTKAMEALDFKLNCSFLNIGSGTGYLSTMVGLLIGSGGINHGVELYESNVEYARSKLDEFKLTSPWYDPALFGDPHFVVGNGLLLSSNNRRYDRIYCGAACTTTESQELFRSLLEINGVLVMPTESQLVAITRLGEEEFRTDVILSSVAFAPLISPSAEKNEDLASFTIGYQIPTLKEICRLSTLTRLKRERYKDIDNLPLPTPMKTFLKNGRDSWGPPLPAPKKLCPIDHSKHDAEMSEEEAMACGLGEGARGRQRRRGSRQEIQFGFHGAPGRRIMLCTVNGVAMEIPLNNFLGDPNSSNGDEDSDDDNVGGLEGHLDDSDGMMMESDQDMDNSHAMQSDGSKEALGSESSKEKNSPGLVEEKPVEKQASTESQNNNDDQKSSGRGNWFKKLFKKKKSNSESKEESTSVASTPSQELQYEDFAECKDDNKHSEDDQSD